MDGSQAMGSWRREDPPPPNPAHHVHPPVSQTARIQATDVLDSEIAKLYDERAKLLTRILNLEAAKRLLREAV